MIQEGYFTPILNKFMNTYMYMYTSYQFSKGFIDYQIFLIRVHIYFQL